MDKQSHVGSSRTFSTLYDFIENKMRMPHVYQPLMLTALVECSGETNTSGIAKTLPNRRHLCANAPLIML